MSHLKELAKFACGWEAFHAVTHAYFWWADLPLTALGVTASPRVSLFAAALASVLAIFLGVYAWGGLAKGARRGDGASPHKDFAPPV